VTSSDYGAGWQRSEAPESYERDLAREGWYGGWLEQRERELLFEIVDRWVGGRVRRHLDFACGTGRIVVALRDRADDATAIDASAAMLEVARTKAPDVSFVCGDPTVDTSLVPGPYDVITAFRFFLNAEERLRHDVLEALRERLGDLGVLVFNVHSNAWSLRALSVWLRRLVFGERGWNQLSHRDVRAMVEAHGLQIVDVHGYNYFTSKGATMLSPPAVLRLERLISRWRPIRFLAVNLM